MGKTILVSFRESEEKLYNKIKSQSDQSAFFKDAARFYFKYLDLAESLIYNIDRVEIKEREIRQELNIDDDGIGDILGD